MKHNGLTFPSAPAMMGKVNTRVVGGKDPLAGWPTGNAMRLNAVIPDEWWRSLEKRLITTAREKMIARQVVGSDISDKVEGLGKQEYSFDTIAEMSEADSAEVFMQASRDAINLSRTNVKLLVHQKDWFIPRRSLEAARQNGQQLDMHFIEAAAYQVMRRENASILYGYSADGTNYDVNGLYKGAGNADANSLDYGTAANIATSLQNNLGLLEDDGFEGPYNAVLRSTQRNQMRAMISGGSITYRKWVEEELEGKIFSSPAMVAGTGLFLAAPGAGAYKMIRGWDLDTFVTEVGPQRDLWGKTFVISGLAIYDSNGMSQAQAI